MKLFIDLTSLADHLSGIERYAMNLSLELIKHKEVDFILLFKGQIHPAFKAYKKADNVTCKVLRTCNKLLFNQIVLPRAVKKMDCDYYFFPAFPNPIFLRKKNMITTIHDVGCFDCPETMKTLSRIYFQYSYKHSAKSCQFILTVSEFSMGRIAERLPKAKGITKLIYDGIEDKMLALGDSANDDPDGPGEVIKKKSKAEKIEILEKYKLPERFILSLSTLEPRKNLSLLVKAYAELIEKKATDRKLVLAGRLGWKMEDFLAEFSEDVKKNIVFTGFIDDEDLPALYGMADLFVFPSKYEGFGIPPLEALACGTRVLSSDAASLPEVLGEAANYFKSDNVQDLKEKLQACIDQREKLDEMNKRKMEGYRQAQKFNWKSSANQLLELMEENM